METLNVVDGSRAIAFSYEAMLDYAGPGSPGGVAHAFKVLERALPLLSPDGPPDRRELWIATAFGGPGARDGFELVTRAVTEGRYVIEPSLERPERGRALERFVFRFRYRKRELTLVAREGYVLDELLELSRRPQRSDHDDARLAELKLEMAGLVIAAPAADVYAVEPD
jgi:hypothetical protein